MSQMDVHYSEKQNTDLPNTSTGAAFEQHLRSYVHDKRKLPRAAMKNSELKCRDYFAALRFFFGAGFGVNGAGGIASILRKTSFSFEVFTGALVNLLIGGTCG